MKFKIISILLAVSLLIGTGVFKITTSNDLKNITEEYEVTQKSNQNDLLEQIQKEITIDPTGSPSGSVNKDNDLINEVFEKATTFENGESYTKNRNELEKLVTNKTFFKKYMPEDVDVTGNSYVDGLGAKSIFSTVTVYQLDKKHEYLTIVESIPYTKDETMDIKDLDKLNKKIGGFIITVSSDGAKINGFKQIKGFNNK